MKITRFKVKPVLLTLCIVGLAFLVGFMAGFFEATGGLPMGIGRESMAPPSGIAKATLAEIEQTLAPVTQMEYREGFTCLDFAWEAMRRLHWAGQLAMIARLDLSPDPDHAVLIVPTSDEGWVFIEPQTGERIYPAAGGKYMDFTAIEGVYMMGLNWTPIDVYLLGINQGIVDTSSLSYYADNE
jgi:hypothetical protein